jgi:polyferredoxin
MLDKRQKWRKALLLFSFLLFPITIFYFSPYLIIEGAAEGIITGSMLLFASLLLLSLFLGRVFCGWLCPVGGLSEAVFPLNNKPANNRYNWIKFVIWLPWLGGLVFAVIRAGGLRIFDPGYKTLHGISIHQIGLYAIYYGMVGLILFLILRRGKRAFCHHVCWISPFMIVGKKLSDWLKLPGLKLKTRPEACTHCKLCEQSCPMSLPVENLVAKGMITHSECILCGMCADSCPQKVIAFGIYRKK